MAGSGVLEAPGKKKLFKALKPPLGPGPNETYRNKTDRNHKLERWPPMHIATRLDFNGESRDS